ncbi:MAG: hypothetical protein AMS26_19645 [Bacteroides sp. SM23_62]|nr:MAG: hypothetical protein AMS26_19645 [Bacteroides sp. SM23_62]
MIKVKLPADWELGFQKEKDLQPQEWHPASVPGAVQLDMMHTLEERDWTRGDGYRQFRWMEDVWWTYRTRFDKPSLSGSDRLYFHSKGIDYAFEISLNGKALLQQEGMFRRVDLDLTDHLEVKNDLRIQIAPVPKSHHERDDRTQANRAFKPAVSYGWDWHPRLVPLGIWDETSLEIRRDFLHDIRTRYSLDDSLENADLAITANVAAGVESVSVSVECKGDTVHKQEFRQGEGEFSGSIKLEKIRLWWPAGHGEPDLYELIVSAFDRNHKLMDEHRTTIGFRKVRLVRNTGTEREDPGFPKSRLLPPVTLEINNRRIFAQGTNWVNPEIFPGVIGEDRYRDLIVLAAGIGFNIFRVWGGGIVNKDFFHECCDRTGMMVWQEFPLACNDYPDDESYLSVLRPEARAIIERVGQHPSTVLWSGGNELYNSWSGMDDQSLALRWINSLCLELTPEIPFIPTSPLQGMGHGHYLFYDPSSDEDICQLMARMNNTALTEYGVPSPSDAEIIRKIIPLEEIFPPSPDSAAWIVHHAFKSWQDDTWLCPEVIEKYYGSSENLEEMVERGQKLQAAGYRFIYEAARQKWPYCSMAINWCYNEPWPTAANNSIVQHPALPKPACESIREACRPVMASASFPKYQWHPGEMLEFDLFMLNHSARDIPAGKMTIAVNGGDIKTWQFGEVQENTVLKGPRLMIRVPARVRDQGMTGMEIALKVLGHPEWDSVYKLPVKA